MYDLDHSPLTSMVKEYAGVRKTLISNILITGSRRVAFPIASKLRMLLPVSKNQVWTKCSEN